LQEAAAVDSVVVVIVSNKFSQVFCLLSPVHTRAPEKNSRE
jgi:hypothetical protein